MVEKEKFIEDPKLQEIIKDQKFAINWLTLLAIKNLKEVIRFKHAFDSIDNEDPFNIDKNKIWALLEAQQERFRNTQIIGSKDQLEEDMH